MFGGVYLWAAVALAIGSAALAFWIRPSLAPRGSLRVVDLSLAAVLAGIAIQLIPLPAVVVSTLSPGHMEYMRAARLDSALPSLLPLTLDRSATLHAWLATFCIIATYWIARTIFSRGGIRALVTALAWTAVALVLVTLAQSAANTPLVYGFWRPYDSGARPLGPFINRNHAGTWSLLALLLSFGCFQWRRASTSPARGWRWRSRIAHALNGRNMILVLAVVLLTVNVALGASRSTMFALACAAASFAWAAPKGREGRGSWLWTATVALVAMLAFIAYADLERLLSRIDETRQLGFSGRIAIWRDTLAVIRDFPVTGVGAGNFSNAMRLYQSSDRSYFWNEAHSQYLQVAAEGGMLLVVPTSLAIIALAACAWRLVRRHDSFLRMRLGACAALIAVAIQAIWETGLSLPANGMLAAVAAAILVSEPRQASNAPARE